MSEHTEDSRSQYESGSGSQATTVKTEIDENEESKDEAEKEQQDSEEPSPVPDDQEEPKEEGNEEIAEAEGSAEGLKTIGEEEAGTEEFPEEITESVDAENMAKLAQEIDEVDEGEIIDAEQSEAEEAGVEKQEEVQEEENQEELTEGEKMSAEIDETKVIEEADTELDYDRPEVQEEVSRVTLHQEELPEIRGLAELEYESPDDSQKEVTFDEYFVSKRKSMRPSVAVKLSAEEEAAEKKRRGRRDIAKGRKIQEEEEIPEVIEIPLTRDEYYALHEKLIGDISYIRMKNRYLQRKMADFFKKRKMEHALKEEVELHAEAILKYEKKSDRSADLSDVYNAETAKIGKEIDVSQKEKEEKYSERLNLFQTNVGREREIGIGSISTKTGKEIPDKVVEQLIRRQVNAAKQISDSRSKYITKRDELAEKTAELKSLDNIGDDLSSMDYEQLKIENRAHSDKSEEKEEELTKLRVKCRNAVQIMAHVREKSAALDADMDVLKEEFEEVHYQYIEIRERLNFYKTERDVIRNKTMKSKEESGLLTKPKSLQDMETSMQEMKLYEKTSQKVKNEYNEKTQQIRNLRKNIAYEMVMSKKHHRERRKRRRPAQYYKVRPTLIVPKSARNFLDRLAANSKAQEDD